LTFRNPQNMREHLRKSGRFQHSEREMTAHFGARVTQEYRIPFDCKLRAIGKEAAQYPLDLICYLAIYAYSRFARERAEKALEVNWEVDRSTKRVA
jgi:hypothetical protein